MAVNKQVNVTLNGTDNLSPIAKKASKILGEDLAQNVAAVGKAFVVMNQSAQLIGATFNKIGGAFSTVVKAANKQEDAVNKLNSSLMQLGEFTPQVSAELQAYASQLQDVTRYGDEATLEQIAFAQAMGASVDQSKTIVAAAADMATALNMDFGSAVRNLSKTLGGLPGELGEVLPELKALTKEQLQAGKGIELLSKKYLGFAQRDLKTFSGAMDQGTNAFGDLLEQVGFLITKSPTVIRAITSTTKMLKDMTKSIMEMDFEKLVSDIEDFGVSLGIAGGVVGAYVLAANGAAIATAVWTTATTALGAAFAFVTGPIGLTIAAVAALTAGIMYLRKNMDTVIGSLKVGLGSALEFVTFGLRTLLKGISLAVGVFDKDLAASINSAVVELESMASNLKSSGQAQMQAAKIAKEHSKAQTDVVNTTTSAIQKIQQNEQALVKLNVQYGKAAGAAEAAFKAAEQFSPRIKLDKFLQEQSALEKSLQDIIDKGNELKIGLSSQGTQEAQQQIDEINSRQTQAEEALKSLKIRKQQEIRDARINEVVIELEMKRQKVFSTEEEIKQLKLSAAQETRDQLVQIESQRLLEERGMLSADAQAGISIKTEAAIQANQIELEAFRKNLNAQKEMALSIESQKQLELAELRSSLVSGTSQESAATNNTEIIKEQQKLAQLKTLREQELISEQQYQMDKNAIIQAGKQRQFEMEVALEQERIQALGLSPEALQAKLDLQREMDAMELENLRFKLQQKQLTEEEFRIASQDLESQSLAKANPIRSQQLQQEIALNRAKGENWKATLKEIELAQVQHGKVMGTLRAVQGSAEFQAINGALSNLSSLRSSESRKQFEIGKKAAIAQATVSTFMGATQAYASLSGIPIVGPVLGAAAAAAAIAAGLMNIKQIKSQKFQGGSAGGGSAAGAAPTPSATLGGQADKGMDAVPRSLSGKSFVLSAGERVVQPEANKDLTNFLQNPSTGNNYNITVNAGAGADVEAIKKAVMAGIREASERGEPVINKRGVV